MPNPRRPIKCTVRRTVIVGPKESKTIFVPRNDATLIYFSSKPADSAMLQNIKYVSISGLSSRHSTLMPGLVSNGEVLINAHPGQNGTTLEHLKEKIDDPEDPKRRLNNDLRFL